MKIPKLKPNSPEFWKEQEEIIEEKRPCDHPYCPHDGDFKAPKSTTNTKEYYYFCLDHVREYNNSWNYFEGFSEEELESYMKRSYTWDRPTWRAGINPFMETKLRDRVFQFFNEEPEQKTGFEKFFNREEKEEGQENFNSSKTIPEMEALDVLGICPPTDLDAIKKRYKFLVKKYHPDTNREDVEAERKINKINAAYTILKKAYGTYEKMTSTS